jgi:ornithine carbamoyltransferase
MRHFLDLADWSSEDLHAIIDSAIALKDEWCKGGNRPLLRGKVLGMIFQKPSLRTRVSFDVAMQHLGGHAIMLGPDEIGLGKRESIADVSRVLSSYTQIIMARVFAHQHVVELAKWSRVPVINGLSDAQHPCQAMADILTIREHFGSVAGRRIVYVGDGNNVAASLGQIAAHFGAHFTLAAPEGYVLDEETLEGIDQIAKRHGGSVHLIQNPAEAVRDADVVYTDTWVSMGQETETSVRREAFRGYQINADLMRSAPAHAVVMHDLPAYRGYEITDDVADGAQSIIFQQAENRLHAQKAILLQLLQ